METAPLKSFATWARTALIREVSARIVVVLAPASSERIEQPDAVAALEKAVSAAGGGDVGRVAVADKGAYTWFNRIVALRFMDANGYTGVGVVSPERGGHGGQPEVLAEAKRGNIDDTVVTNKHTLEAVTGLLNGTRRSGDPQGEAYALLLAEYCRFWNRSMPFMFEREGDFTELLIPANLLADDSVLARAVAVLTEEVCQDVEVIGWLYQFYISERKDEVFAGFKKNQKAGAAEIPAATQLFTPHWIVRYLVENSLGRLWLLNRPTSRLVEQMEYYIEPVDEETDFLKIASPEELKIIDPACGSGHMLTYAFDLLYTIYEEEGYAPSDIPELILTNNLYGTEIDPRAGALAAFALTMKARARQRTFFTKQVGPNICVLEPISFTPDELDLLNSGTGDRADEEAFWNQFQHADAFGSLIQPQEHLIEPLKTHLQVILPDDADLILGDLHARAQNVVRQAEYLSTPYHVVVTNPPYMGSKNMAAGLKDFAKREYPDSKHDLFAMFIERSLELTLPQGILGLVTMQSWMFLRSFESIRFKLLSGDQLHVVAHLGPSAFEAVSGQVVSAVAWTMSNEAPRHAAVFVGLTTLGRTEKGLELRAIAGGTESTHVFVRDQREFSKIPGSPVAYSLPPSALDAYALGERMADIAYGQPGLQTSDNGQFLRYWFEVARNRIGVGLSSSEAAKESGCRWFPYLKGGEYRKWYGNEFHVVDWENDGSRIKEYVAAKYPYLNGNVDYVVKDRGYYFKPMISYTKISSGRFAARAARAGYLFDVAGSSVFPNGPDAKLVLGFLCSRLGEMFIRAQNPTMNVQSGDIDKLPFAPSLLRSSAAEIAERVDELVQITAHDWNSRELSWEFDGDSMLLRSEVGNPPFRRLIEAVNAEHARESHDVNRSRRLEAELDQLFLTAYGIDDPSETGIERGPLSISGRTTHQIASDLVSYAVGCMLGRYSLDTPGLVLANQGETLEGYLAKVPNPSFTPDEDNVIPIVDGDWFEDDIVARFRQFLRVAFGEEYFEENLRFVTESLGVKDLRDYFVKSFYKDHVKRYKKRPIYWLFSSPKGSFNALISMHRYIPSTVSTVLNEYLREFSSKLEASRQHHERLATGDGTSREKAAAQKEVDRLRKVLLELEEYEHDVLYPLATQQVQIDLDDGVKVNYPKFGAALKKIPGLEGKK